MGDNDNAHLRRMAESIKNVIGIKEAMEYEEKYPLSKAAGIEKKHEWAKASCEYLESKYDEDTIKLIREKCICNDGKATAMKMLKYLNKTNNLEQFTQMFNENESFANLEYICNNKLLFCYPECYCACVKRINRPLPETWCYCTLGYVKSMFSQVFGKEVEAQLISSIKKGDGRCAVSIEW